MKKFFCSIFVFCLFILNTSSAQIINKGVTEKLELKVNNGNLISYNQIIPESSATLQERESLAKRGIISDIIIPKGIQGIQSLINNRQKKFTTDYSFSTTNESFYDQISTKGAFDPSGIRFQGFTVQRILKNKDNTTDTVFIAKFSLDTTQGRLNAIMNNGIFVLKLDSFILKKPKVKITKHKNSLNFDFDITFTSSYITGDDAMSSAATVGKFTFTIRDAPVNPSDPNYQKFYDDLLTKKCYCTGQSFLIPRSAGFYRSEEDGSIQKCFGKGLFSINVAVKESSVAVKESKASKLVDQVVVNNSTDLLNQLKTTLQKKIKN